MYYIRKIDIFIINLSKFLTMSFVTITPLLENQNLEYISCFIKFIGKGSKNNVIN